MPSSRRRRPGRMLATVLVVALLVAGGLLAWQKVTGTERSFTARCVAGTEGDAAALTLEQSDIAALIGAIAVERGLPARALTIAIATDRKSTRLNSSHVAISYAVFCMKKKTTTRLPQMHK